MQEHTILKTGELIWNTKKCSVTPKQARKGKQRNKKQREQEKPKIVELIPNFSII